RLAERREGRGHELGERPREIRVRDDQQIVVGDEGSAQRAAVDAESEQREGERDSDDRPERERLSRAGRGAGGAGAGIAHGRAQYAQARDTRSSPEVVELGGIEPPTLRLPA